MADRKLKIIFNGISTLSPGPPLPGEAMPNMAYVRMAANYDETLKNDWDALVELHFPFVYVPESVLVNPIPNPLRRVKDEKLGMCNIYVLANARVTFEPKTTDKLDYYIDKDHDLGERPGSDDVANEHDIRWLADIRDHVNAAQSTPRSDAKAPGPEVAVIVDLPGGTLKAEFPCKSVQAQTFKTISNVISGKKRVLANEFSIEMSYPEKTSRVTLQLLPLRTDSKPTGIDGNELTLQWPDDEEELVVRMGNDTLAEADLAASPKRCNARVRSATDQRPILRPRDDDFFLHYDLLNIPAGAPRPLPQAGPHQTSGDGCKPAVVRGNP